MKNIRRTLALVLALVFALSMVSFAAPEEGGDNNIQPGTVVDMGYATQMNVHLPYITVQTSFIAMNIYDTLFYFVDGDANNIGGLLAEEWTYDEDNLGVTVKLHDNACFYTGDPITAQTCIDCWETTRSFMPTYFGTIEEITAVDDHTLYFKFSDKFPTFEVNFADTITSIVDPKAIAEYGDTSNEAAVGSGPYYIENYIDGEVLTLHANPNYWFEARKPHIETVNIYYIADANTQLIAMQSGDIDLMMTQDPIVLYTLEETPGVNVTEYQAQALTCWINEEYSDVLQIAEVRQALAHLIDWQAACDIVYDGLYSPATGIWKEGTAGYVDNTENFTYDPDLGLALLEEAGVDPADIKLEMLCYPKYKDVFVAVQSQLAQYGITFDVPTNESSAVASLHAAGDFCIASSWLGYTGANPMAGFSAGILPTGAQTSVFLDNCAPEAAQQLYDLYDQAATADSLEEQYAICREMTKVLQDNYVNLGGIQLRHWLALSDEFDGLNYQNNVFYIDFCYMYQK